VTDDDLNIFITRCATAGTRRCGVKDLIDTAGIRTTYGSRVYADHVPVADAPAWARLSADGWTLAGKTNLHEFAYGVTSQNQHYGTVRNPHDPSRVAGGSSGGSAAGIVTGAFELGLATDTAGSIRIPASFCGVVGFKGSVGVVPTEGCFPLVPWLDHVGPIAADVATCADAYATLAGTTPATAIDAAGLTIALPRDLGHVDGSILAAFDRSLGRLREHGVRFVEVDLPPLPLEIIRVRLVVAAFVHRATYPSRRDEYGLNLQGKLDAGLEPYDHLAALGAIADVDDWKRAFAGACAGADLIAMPTIPVPAPSVDAPEASIRGTIFAHTQLFNHLGWASITVPNGSDRDGMPTGLMLSGAGDALVLGAALGLEGAIRAA
jgi:aspartyl-tRNA(Asn)/glutamyl-tRNA(Gln) amidotransferase subunit A